ncbi:hypothetical protein [Sutcliffiella horikoshii]|uniref:hypothetical protein n=1 Tax=Sutcliffiella horikoshii TaxID=79883 RepID=UPI00384E473E
MKYMITHFEKEAVLSHADEVAEKMISVNENLSPVLLKMLINSLEKTIQSKMNFYLYTESQLADKEIVKMLYSDLLKSIAIASVEERNTVIKYKTGELSKYFGVSQTTINNWIKEGRFSDVERTGENKHAKIPEHSIWTAGNGEQKTIKEVVEQYQTEHFQLTDIKEKEIILQEIRYFQDKYHSFDELVTQENKTIEEEEDAKEWGYLLSRYSKS